MIVSYDYQIWRQILFIEIVINHFSIGNLISLTS